MDRLPHICHLSVLNPLQHSRIFHRAAISQQRAGFPVSIIAQGRRGEAAIAEGVRLMGTGEFGRLSWDRWRVPRKILDLARSVKADVIQVHTPELLVVAQQLKAEQPGIKVIYDRHEDYAANFQHGDYLPVWSRKSLARWVKRREAGFAEWGDGLVLAEKMYQGQIPFPEKRTVVIQNKFRKPQFVGEPPFLQGYMLYTGTLAEIWGIGRTLELWRMLNELEPMRLVVAGHSQRRKPIAKIHQFVREHRLEAQFHLLGGTDYIPHEKIVSLISGCQFGTALYDPLPHLRAKLPTKFFEYLGMGKPLVYTDSAHWNDFNAASPFGIPLRSPFDRNAVAAFWKALQIWKPVSVDPEVWSWEPEGQKMVDFLRRIWN